MEFHGEKREILGENIKTTWRLHGVYVICPRGMKLHGTFHMEIPWRIFPIGCKIGTPIVQDR